MLVEQLMNQPPVTCSAADSLAAAAHLMWDGDCGALPVTDLDRRPIGIITDRDICMAAFMKGLALHEIPVEHAMARDVHVCHPGDPIGVAEKTMQDLQVRRLPVVDEAGRVVGVLSLCDLARHAEQQDGRRRPEVSDVEVSRTLAAIGQPHHKGELVRNR